MCFLRGNNNRLKLAEAVLSGAESCGTETRNVAISRLPEENKYNMLPEQTNITCSDASDSRAPLRFQGLSLIVSPARLQSTFLR